MTSDMSPGYGSGYADGALWELVDKGLADRLVASSAPDAVRRLSGRGLNRTLGGSKPPAREIPFDRSQLPKGEVYRVRRTRPQSKPAAGPPPPDPAARDVSRGSVLGANVPAPMGVPFKPAEAVRRKPSGKGWGDFEHKARSGMVGSGGVPWAGTARVAAPRSSGGDLSELRRMREAAEAGRFRAAGPAPGGVRMGPAAKPKPAAAAPAAPPAPPSGPNPWVWGGLAGVGAAGAGGAAVYGSRRRER